MRPRALNRRDLLAASFAVAATSAGQAGAAAEATPAGARVLKSRLTADDRLGIQELFSRYAWTFDCSDEEGYLASFTEDALVIGVSPEQVFRGSEAIRGWYRYLLNLRAQDDEDWLHDAYHHVIQGNRRSCMVYSYATHFNSNAAAKRSGVRSVGYFVSECVQRGDVWLFRRHSVNRWDRSSLPWSKPPPWATVK